MEVRYRLQKAKSLGMTWSQKMEKEKLTIIQTSFFPAKHFHHVSLYTSDM